MNLGRLSELFCGVDWRPFEAWVNGLYSMEGKGRRPKPPLAYLRAVLVKMLWEISSFRKLVDRLSNNQDLSRICGFEEGDPPSRNEMSRFLSRLAEAGWTRSS